MRNLELVVLIFDTKKWGWTYKFNTPTPKLDQDSR